jgi:hypothetical protein
MVRKPRRIREKAFSATVVVHNSCGMCCDIQRIQQNHCYNNLSHADFGINLKSDLRCAVSAAPLAELYLASKLLCAGSLTNNVLPCLIQCFLYLLRYVDDFFRRYDIVTPMNETVVSLVEPERIFLFPELIHGRNFASMHYFAFSTQRSDWT